MDKFFIRNASLLSPFKHSLKEIRKFPGKESSDSVRKQLQAVSTLDSRLGRNFRAYSRHLQGQALQDVYFKSACNHAEEVRPRLDGALKILDSEKQSQALGTILTAAQNFKKNNRDFCGFFNSDALYMEKIHNYSMRSKILIFLSTSEENHPEKRLHFAEKIMDLHAREEVLYQIAMDHKLDEHDIYVCLMAAKLLNDLDRQEAAYVRIAIRLYHPDSTLEDFLEHSLAAANLIRNPIKQQDAYVHIARRTVDLGWNPITHNTKICLAAADLIQDPIKQQDAYVHITKMFQRYNAITHQNNIAHRHDPSLIEAACRIADPKKQAEAFHKLIQYSVGSVNYLFNKALSLPEGEERERILHCIEQCSLEQPSDSMSICDWLAKFFTQFSLTKGDVDASKKEQALKNIYSFYSEIWPVLKKFNCFPLVPVMNILCDLGAMHINDIVMRNKSGGFVGMINGGIMATTQQLCVSLEHIIQDDYQKYEKGKMFSSVTSRMMSPEEKTKSDRFLSDIFEIKNISSRELCIEIFKYYFLGQNFSEGLLRLFEALDGSPYYCDYCDNKDKLVELFSGLMQLWLTSQNGCPIGESDLFSIAENPHLTKFIRSLVSRAFCEQKISLALASYTSSSRQRIHIHNEALKFYKQLDPNCSEVDVFSSLWHNFFIKHTGNRFHLSVLKKIIQNEDVRRFKAMKPILSNQPADQPMPE